MFEHSVKHLKFAFVALEGSVSRAFIMTTAGAKCCCGVHRMSPSASSQCVCWSFGISDSNTFSVEN